MTRFETVLEAGCDLGESPVWSVERAALFFADITGRRLHRYDPAAGLHESWPVDEDLGCVAPAQGGGFVAAMRSGMWRLDGEGRKVARLAANPEDPATSRFNDGKVDPRGRFLAGTVDERKLGKAALYRLAADGLVRLVDGVLTSNGLAWSPDGRTLYHADTPRFAVRAYDYDLETGEIANRRVFFERDHSTADRARPDGAAVDVEGCYWSALYGGARVARYDPEGRLIGEFAAPAKNVTMPAFGGADLKTLYLTSARDAASGEGGDVYAMSVAVAGLASRPFDPSA
jgi:sugar lactone lactonase YvrE